MKIKKNACYICYESDKDNDTCILAQYTDVGEFGFSINNYIVSDNDIYYEPSEWHVFNTDVPLGHKRIRKQLYERWDNKVSKCRLELEKYVKSNLTTMVGTNEADVYLYIPNKEIFAEKYPDYCDSSDVPSFSLVHILQPDPKEPVVTTIYISMVGLSSNLESHILDEDEVMDVPKSFLISKEVYDYVANRIKELSKELIEEIKNEYLRLKKI